MKNTVLAGLAVLAIATQPSMAKDQFASRWSWTGAYLGVNAGYGVAEIFAPPGSSSIPRPTGGLWGVQAGANYQFASHWVIGAEVDGALARLEGTESGIDPNFAATLISNTIKGKSLTTVRGRFGYAFDQTLLYATAGAAWDLTEVTASTSNYTPGVPRTVTSSRLMNGWTAGGGIERRLWSNWSVRAEYLFVRNGYTTFSSAGTDPDPRARSDLHIVRVGVNWLFR